MKETVVYPCDIFNVNQIEINNNRIDFTKPLVTASGNRPVRYLGERLCEGSYKHVCLIVQDGGPNEILYYVEPYGKALCSENITRYLYIKNGKETRDFWVNIYRLCNGKIEAGFSYASKNEAEQMGKADNNWIKLHKFTVEI